MATAVVHYTAAAVTDRGRKRPSNEDAFGFSVEAGVYVVCDGMGGAAAGEVASSLAVDEVLRMVTHRGDDDNIPLVTAAEKAIYAANEAIYSRAQRNQRLSGMGTTLVVMAAKESHVWVLNIGDSRCYRYRQGRAGTTHAGPLAGRRTGEDGPHDPGRGAPLAVAKCHHPGARYSVSGYSGCFRV